MLSMHACVHVCCSFSTETFIYLMYTRECILQQAIESGLPDKDVKTMCMKYAELEKSLGEIDRARAIYVFSSQFADPRSDADFWNKWHEFEVQHGNEDTFREMLRIKRSVSASYSQVGFDFHFYLHGLNFKTEYDFWYEIYGPCILGMAVNKHS